MSLNVLQGVYPESSIGQGIQTGLKGLMDQLGQQQKTKQLTQMFAKGGYPENIANILGRLASTNPEVLPKILENLQAPTPKMPQQSMAGDNQQQNQLGQQMGGGQMMQEGMPQQQPQQEQSFAQSYRSKDDAAAAAQQNKFDWEVQKHFEPYIDEKTKLRDTIEENDARLQRIEQIDAIGNPMNRYAAQVAAGLHLPMGNEDTQELMKLTQDFVKNAKPYFGSKMTQQEVEMYMKTIPSVFNTPEGRARIIRNMRIIGNVQSLEANAIEKIIEQNGGRVPRDIKSRVGKMIKKEREWLLNEFTKGAQSVIGKESNSGSPSIFEDNGQYYIVDEKGHKTQIKKKKE